MERKINKADLDVNLWIYRDIFQNSTIPSALFDMNKRCVLANRCFNVQLGYPLEEKKKKPDLSQIFENKMQFDYFLEQLRERGIVQRQEVRLITHDKQGFPALVSGYVIKSNDERYFNISFINISYIRDLENIIKKDHTKITSIMENSIVGLFYVNTDEMLVNLNTKLMKMLDVDRGKYLGKKVHEWFEEVLSKTIEPEIMQKRLESAISNIEQFPKIELTFKNSVTLHYELALFPVKDDDGVSLGWGGVIQDITELKQQLDWKLDLLSILSHDIRSPLATLKGHISVLRENYPQWGKEMVMTFLETMDKSIDKLSRQVDRNIALTRVEGGDLGLRPQAVDLIKCVEQAISYIADKNEYLEIDLIHEEPLAKIRADPARIEEVMINLLDNAVRYNPPNVKIIVEIKPKDSWLIVSVRDFGKGIPADKQKTIFDKYVRADENEKGSGLGLYISRKIIEAHGGQIHLQSPLIGMEKGTEFVFTLPITYTSSTKKENVEKSSAIDNLINQEFTILVVEDEQDQLLFIKTILNEKGYQVDTATNGISALDIIKISQPDLIILDWKLPGMNGLSVCQGIRRFSNKPIIIVTSSTNQEDLLTAFAVGADDYLIKPFDRNELYARINALLRREESIHHPPKSNRFNASGIIIDFDTCEVWKDGKNIFLSRTEYDILKYMAQHRNQLLTYTQIISSINSLMVDDSQNALYIHVSRLRKKIETDPKNPVFIMTHWGIGYIFMPY